MRLHSLNGKVPRRAWFERSVRGASLSNKGMLETKKI